MRYNIGVSKWLKTLLAFVLLFSAYCLPLAAPQKIKALSVPSGSCSSNQSITIVDAPDIVYSEATDALTITITIPPNTLPQGNYILSVYDPITTPVGSIPLRTDIVGNSNSVNVERSGGTFTFTVTEPSAIGYTSEDFSATKPLKRVIYLAKEEINDDEMCVLGYYEIQRPLLSCEGVEISQTRDGQSCYASPDSCIDMNQPITITTYGIKYPDGSTVNQGRWKWKFKGPDDSEEYAEVSNGTATNTFTPDGVLNIGSSKGGTYTLQNFYIHEGINPLTLTGTNCADGSFTLNPQCDDAAGGEDSCNTTKAPVSVGATLDSGPGDYDLCAQIPDADREAACRACQTGGGLKGAKKDGSASYDGKTPGIWTAIGCIPAKPESIVRTFVTVGLNISGGIALLMLLAASFMISTAQGDPKRMNEGKDMFTSAMVGLLFVTFSVTILEFIGVRVLQLPGFGTT